jgi:hypothetical protein
MAGNSKMLSRLLHRSPWVLMLSAFPVVASETVINFDKLPDGTAVAANTTLSTQYQSRGVVFVAGAPVNPDSVLPTTQPDGLASSPPQVASILSSSGGEFKAAVVVGQFTDPHRSYVQVNVGDYGPASETATVYLGVFDAAGKPISQISKTVTGGAGYGTMMRIDVPAPTIAYFGLSGGFNHHVAIDDLRFDTPPAVTGPDFSLLRTDPPMPVYVAPGKSAMANLLVTRSGGFTGAVTLSLDSTTTGLSAKFAPNPVTTATGDRIKVTFTASSTLTSRLLTPLVTGSASGAGAPGPHSIVIPVVIRQNYQMQITGIEVTQGIQSASLPVRGSGGTVSYSDPSAPGVKLAEDAKTVVRVFGNAGSDAPAGGVTAVTANLSGYDASGKTLPGSPLLNEDGPHTLTSGSGVVLNNDDERWNPSGAFVFTLPPEWTRGTIRLSAKLWPPTFFDAPALADCDCSRATLDMTDVAYTATSSYWVAPVAAFERDSLGKPVPLPAPGNVFSSAANLLPLAPGLLFVLPYQGSIDISDITDPPSGDDANGKVFGRVWKFASDQEWAGNRPGDTWIGVNGRPGPSVAIARGLEGPRPMIYREFIGGPDGDYRVNFVKENIAVVDYNRPLTSVAHELGHTLGRPHADTACGGGGSPDPPSNIRGDILGVGLDRRSSPYKILAAGAKGQPGEWYDYMSYCTDNYPETNSWISTTGWNGLFSRFASGSSSAAPTKAESAARKSLVPMSLVAAATPASPFVHVIAWGMKSGLVQIDSVTPRTGTPMPAPANSDYVLVVRDAQQRVAGQARMQADEEHGNRGGEYVLLTGEAAAANAASVEIYRSGKLVASRQRSADAPVVSIQRPAAGEQAGVNGSIEVDWIARDPDSNALMVAVDYSSDDGITWVPLHLGPNLNTATLPSTLTKQSDRARVRVRVNDGFNETAAVSERFSSAGAPPELHIDSPVRGAKIAVGANMYLSGTAFNDSGRAINPQSMIWSANGQPIGTGAVGSFRVPAAQSILIALRVADQAGRNSEVTVSLSCAMQGQSQGICIVQ